MRKQKAQIQKIIKEWKDASPKEVWEGVRDNFSQLQDTLTNKNRGEGIKFNEITGEFEAIDSDDTSQKTKELINQ